ncbi:MAG: flagellar basal-body rod protein FlgG [Magnetococcales bacterium]|nr:flagellar basal-body rod protein FlgG [Magnetococcales bacterium]
MIRGMYTAASGMDAAVKRTDVIANNLANVSTTGYKAQTANFKDVFYAILKPAGVEGEDGTRTPVGIQVGHGVTFSSTSTNFGTGSAIDANSSDPNDVTLAINGQGFFKVTDGNGREFYTRDGTFQKNQQGKIVTSSGMELINLGETAQNQISGITINPDGAVSIQRPDGTTTPKDPIKITLFINPDALIRVGNNLYMATEEAGQPETGTPGTEAFGTLMQHKYEASNVNMVTEMVNMINNQRAYEIGSKAIHTADEMTSLVKDLKR